MHGYRGRRRCKFENGSDAYHACLNLWQWTHTNVNWLLLDRLLHERDLVGVYLLTTTVLMSTCIYVLYVHRIAQLLKLWFTLDDGQIQVESTDRRLVFNFGKMPKIGMDSIIILSSVSRSPGKHGMDAHISCFTCIFLFALLWAGWVYVYMWDNCGPCLHACKPRRVLLLLFLRFLRRGIHVLILIYSRVVQLKKWWALLADATARPSIDDLRCPIDRRSADDSSTKWIGRAADHFLNQSIIWAEVYENMHVGAPCACMYVHVCV